MGNKHSILNRILDWTAGNGIPPPPCFNWNGENDRWNEYAAVGAVRYCLTY